MKDQENALFNEPRMKLEIVCDNLFEELLALKFARVMENGRNGIVSFSELDAALSKLDVI